MKDTSKEALLVLAYLYLEHFKYEKALNLLKVLSKIYPKDLHIKRSLAFAYLKTGDYQAALRASEACIKPNLPKNLIIAANLIKSKALWGLGKEEAARHSITQLKEISQKPE